MSTAVHSKTDIPCDVGCVSCWLLDSFIMGDHAPQTHTSYNWFSGQLCTGLLNLWSNDESTLR